MSTKLQALQEKASNIQNALTLRKKELARATEAVMSDPASKKAAQEAAALEMQVKATEAAYKAAQEAVEAESERLEGPEAKKALKELDKINSEGAALTVEITEAAKALNDQMDRWVELKAQSKRLADRWGGKPFDLGIAGSRLMTLKRSVGSWVQEVHSWERQEEILAKPNRGVKLANPKKSNPIGEREKMLKERYPEPKG